MKNTLSDLKTGKLKGTVRLTLSEKLTTFPEEIFELADTLEYLDLSHNLLTEIPAKISELKKLKIAFFSYNLLTSVPDVKACKHLYMLGLKGNQIERFDEDILPLSISWLILTDNRLTALPHSIGKLSRLQKFPLAGNLLTALPQEMAACKNLEMLRLSANQLTEIPQWLLSLPKLAWLAFSGNPCALPPSTNIEQISHDTIVFKDLLGEGASGRIYKGYASSLDKDVAIKLFKGSVTSDGYAKDEMDAYMNTGDHHHLIKVLAQVQKDEDLGLVLEFIPTHYQNLGLPPDFDSCTRDTFEAKTQFEIETIYAIAKAILSASTHLHAKGMMHGDLYAHNILIDRDENHCYLTDFGAATFYDTHHKEFEKIEVRAFGCLIEDLLQYCSQKEHATYHFLEALSKECMNEDLQLRPLFSQISLPKL